MNICPHCRNPLGYDLADPTITWAKCPKCKKLMKNLDRIFTYWPSGKEPISPREKFESFKNVIN